jgi:hypothetical protein
MEPLQPSRSNKSGGYKNTGYALGVKQENSDDSADISKISAVWNFLKILHKLFGKEFIEEDMKRKFQEGFSPEILSKKGILFLNMALTRGNDGENTNTDIDIWMDYTIEVLREIGERNEDVLIFQFYKKQKLENFLKQNKEKFIVIMPSFMSDWQFNHISYFMKDVKNIDMTPDYVEEIKKALERHRRIKAKEDKEPLEVLRKGMDQLKLEYEIAMDPIECLKEWLEEVLEKTWK